MIIAAAFTSCSTPAPTDQRTPSSHEEPVGSEYLRGWTPGGREIATFRTSTGGEYTETTELAGRFVHLRRAEGGFETRVTVSLDPVGGRPAGSHVEISRQPDGVRIAAQGWFLQALTTVPAGARKQILRYPEAAVVEDVLPLCARRVAWPRLRLGQAYRAEVLRAATGQWQPARLSLSDARYTAETPAGSYRVHVFEAAFSSGETRRWYTQTDPPHRIVKYEGNREYSAALGSVETRQLPDAK